jgi:hypothetical protein
MRNLSLFGIGFCIVALAFILGTLFGRTTIANEHENFLKGKENKALRAQLDNVSFQLDASKAHYIDLPEEHPTMGDNVCAYVRNDTIFVEYWHNYPHQKRYFRYKHGF